MRLKFILVCCFLLNMSSVCCLIVMVLYVCLSNWDKMYFCGIYGLMNYNLEDPTIPTNNNELVNCVFTTSLTSYTYKGS